MNQCYIYTYYIYVHKMGPYIQLIHKKYFIISALSQLLHHYKACKSILLNATIILHACIYITVIVVPLGKCNDKLGKFFSFLFLYMRKAKIYRNFYHVQSLSSPTCLYISLSISLIQCQSWIKSSLISLHNIMSQSNLNS